MRSFGDILRNFEGIVQCQKKKINFHKSEKNKEIEVLT